MWSWTQPARPGHDVALAVFRPTSVLRQQPGPLEHPVDAVDARDTPEARAPEAPQEASRAVAGPPTPAAESPGHPGPDLARVPMRAPGPVGEAQAVPLAGRVAAPPLVVGLPGDPEEGTGVGDRV